MRTLLMSLVAVAVTWTACIAGQASAANASSPSDVAQNMVTTANVYLNSLSDSQKKIASMPFEHPERQDWTNVPKDHRKGIQIREMNPQQRENCFGLLKASLSEVGFEKMENILALESNLHILEKGQGPFRDPLRYFLTIFGTPAMDGTWGYSFEGHHLSLNFVVVDGKIIGDTPAFWGSCPAYVHTLTEEGVPTGIRNLAQEEQLAFDLLGTFTPEQLKKAVVSKTAPGDYRHVGNPVPPSSPGEGISVAELNAEQKAALWNLLTVYSGNLAGAVSAQQLKEIEDAGFEKVHFAWLGATQPGEGHYYQIEGPTFVLELINVQSDPEGNKANHIHSVWRSLVHDFGFNTANR